MELLPDDQHGQPQMVQHGSVDGQRKSLVISENTEKMLECPHDQQGQAQMVQHDSDRQRKSLVIQENTEKMLECLQAEVKARILFLPIFLKCCIPFCFRVNSFKGVAALERFAAKQLASQGSGDFEIRFAGIGSFERNWR